jgi:hypothetical protein
MKKKKKKKKCFGRDRGFCLTAKETMKLLLLLNDAPEGVCLSLCKQTSKMFLQICSSSSIKSKP